MKKVLYWVTILPPLIDAVVGAVKGLLDGIKKGVDEAHAQDVAAATKANIAKFDNSNV